MPQLSITRTVKNGTVFTQQQNETQCSDIESFINTTKIDSTNIQSGGIATSNYAAGSVDNTALAQNAVTNAKIADNAVTNAKLSTDIQLPIGMVVAYSANSAPTGWLLCDGSAVSRSTYASLFAVIGITHGQGDAATTFNLPDYRGRFLRGVDGGTGRDPDKASRTAMGTGGNTGDAVGSVQDSTFTAHNHTININDPGHAHGYSIVSFQGGSPSLSGGGQYANGTTGATTAGSGTGITASSNNTGGNETRPINAYVNYIIKT